MQKSLMKFCHNCLNAGIPGDIILVYCLDAEEEDDPDILSDPIYHMNLREYLVQFIQSFTQTQYYETFKVSLTPQECSVLKHVGIS